MFFADPTHIDQSVYDLWLKGLSGELSEMSGMNEPNNSDHEA